jgi:hypothetical protein
VTGGRQRRSAYKTAVETRIRKRFIEDSADGNGMATCVSVVRALNCHRLRVCGACELAEDGFQ